ncbi:hypothetical protein [Kitasatospora paranensis]|uniref:Uncharacterized protein n=1 Tax=Kitasatospora paranensis TaxID=258053 RepID=A0ABW2FV30_9ACTN
MSTTKSVASAGSGAVDGLPAVGPVRTADIVRLPVRTALPCAGNDDGPVASPDASPDAEWPGRWTRCHSALGYVD